MAGGSGKTVTITIQLYSTLKQLKEAIKVAMDLNLEKDIAFFTQRGVKLKSNALMTIILPNLDQRSK
jgi:hypothetical protein